MPKLCDFGWAAPLAGTDIRSTFCGTLDYVSPEMKDKGEYGLNIDIWSLGILTFELLTGIPPLKDEITNWQMKGGSRNKKWNWNITYPNYISEQSVSFMSNILR